jgi:hypothetical protein
MLQMAGFTLKSADHVVRVAGDGETALKDDMALIRNVIAFVLQKFGH